MKIEITDKEMKIEITDKEIRVTWLGRTKVCDFDELVRQFQSLDDRERKRQVINLWDSELFKTVQTKQKEKYEIPARQSPEWDEQAQADEDFVYGCDPYIPLY